MGAKAQKIEKVKELTKRFRESSGAMFADFRGLTVKDATELRRSLNAADAKLLVTKNTLTRIAVKEAGLDERVLDLLEGPTAVAFMGGDPVAGAKVLVDSAKRFPTLVVKGAVVEGRILTETEAEGLATLDSREVSFAKVAGLLTAPLSRVAYLLQAPVQRIAFALAERGRQAGEAEPEAPVAAPAEPEPTPVTPTAEIPEREAPEAAAEAPEPQVGEAEAPEPEVAEAEAPEPEAAQAEAPEPEAAAEPEAEADAEPEVPEAGPAPEDEQQG